jgi:hypothetical protein
MMSEERPGDHKPTHDKQRRDDEFILHGHTRDLANKILHLELLA